MKTSPLASEHWLPVAGFETLFETTSSGVYRWTATKRVASRGEILSAMKGRITTVLPNGACHFRAGRGIYLLTPGEGSMKIIFLDLESYCEVPITHGTHAYAEKAKVMLVAYAGEEGPVRVLDLTARDENDAIAAELHSLTQVLMNPDTTIVMHNGGMFDRTVLRHALGIDLPIERIHDTMVRALAHGLPGSLGVLCEVFKLSEEQAKDKRGKELINLFCKPRPVSSKIRRASRETHPKEWAEFIDYAKSDIISMRVLYEKLPRWNYQGKELALWHLDQKINDRGFQVDLELAKGAVRAVDKAQAVLSKRTKELTSGEVSNATQRDAMLAHILNAYGVALPDLTSSTLDRRVQDPDLPWALRELLAVRAQASTSSTSKYKALLNAVSSDGRMRGTLQFCGASRTGRWAGRTFQPQNLPRPTLKQEEIDHGIEALKLDCADLITSNVMALTSACIRGCIVAPAGRKLVVSDLSNIEGRDAAWLAGEHWKLDAFRSFDAKTGHDLYKLAYAKSFGVNPGDVTKDQRQVGKVQELALQYEGGVGAFLTFAALYRIDLDKLADDAWDAIPSRILTEASSFWDWAVKNRKTLGLSQRAFVTCDSLKRMWRAAHPAISSYWKELEHAAIQAVQSPGVSFPCRKLTLRRDGAWLRMILPSGRAVCYASPKVEDGKLSYAGVDQYSRKWGRLKTYGGKIFENACQAVARDVMTENMPHIEKTGYDLLLTVHDELITEAPDTAEFSVARMNALLATPPPWAPDIPLAAGGFEGYRYRKD